MLIIFLFSQSLKWKQMSADLSCMMVSNFEALFLNILLKLHCAELQDFVPLHPLTPSLQRKAVNKRLFQSDPYLSFSQLTEIKIETLIN